MRRVRSRGLDGRTGENHPRATLSDHDVALARALHEEHGIGVKTIARKFETPHRTMRDICAYRRRTR